MADPDDMTPIIDEIAADPDTRGYAAMLAGPDPYQDLANDLNGLNGMVATRDRVSVTGKEVKTAVTSDAFLGNAGAGLTAEQRSQFLSLTARDDLDLSPGGLDRAILIDMLPDDPDNATSRTNLGNLQNEPISTAVSLIGVSVTAGMLQRAGI